MKAVMAVAGLAGLSVMVKKRREKWESLGKVENFKVGSTTQVSFEDPSPLPWAGVVAKTGAWLRRNPDDTFTAFSLNCTHLGCPVNWEQDAELFLCPCHGGVYTKNGDVAGGPPPHALPRYEVRKNGDEVEILTSELPLT
jgi:menaquinol-cytochrome c reductase iron-sulfur subunit